MRTIKYFSTIIILSVVFVLSSCGSDNKSNSDTSIVANVRLASVSSEVMSFSDSFSARLESSVSSVLSTKLMGSVEKVYVDEGDKVQKGDILIRINAKGIEAKNKQIEANILAAKFSLDNVEKNYNRFEVLLQQESISQKEMDDMQTNYNIAKAKYYAVQQMKDELKQNLNYATIRAPYAAYITKKNVAKGDLASPGMPLLTLERIGPLKIVLKVPAREIKNIKINQSAKIKIADYSDKLLSARVVNINTSATNGSYQVKLLFTDSEGMLNGIYSGMYASVMFQNNSKQGIYVDKNVIVYKGQLTGLYVYSPQNVALLRWVSLGQTKAHKVEILTGLSSGDKYILSSDKNLYDGIKINTVK